MEYKFWTLGHMKIPNTRDTVRFIDSHWVFVIRGDQKFRILLNVNVVNKFAKCAYTCYQHMIQTLGDQSTSVTDRFLDHFSSQNSQRYLIRLDDVSSLILCQLHSFQTSATSPVASLT
jgi:hypothetical protein